MNGFSNSFWGWGGEDDDMAGRIKLLKLKVERYSSDIARYTMIQHRPEEANKDRMKILNTTRSRLKVDGIRDLNYTLVSKTREQLYTNVSALLKPKDLERNQSIKTIETKVIGPVSTNLTAVKYTVAMREAFEKMPIFWKLKLRG